MIEPHGLCTMCMLGTTTARTCPTCGTRNCKHLATDHERRCADPAGQYRHILAWGRLMGSDASYIRNEQEKAARDNAPLDAIFKADDGWHRYADVSNESTRNKIDQILARA